MVLKPQRVSILSPGLSSSGGSNLIIYSWKIETKSSKDLSVSLAHMGKFRFLVYVNVFFYTICNAILCATTFIKLVLPVEYRSVITVCFFISPCLYEVAWSPLLNTSMWTYVKQYMPLKYSVWTWCKVWFKQRMFSKVYKILKLSIQNHKTSKKKALDLSNSLWQQSKLCLWILVPDLHSQVKIPH